MKSLAFFSPHSPLKGGVAHYGDALAKELAKFCKIVFYIDKGYEPEHLAGLGDVRIHTDYRGSEDMTLFQASNGPLHAYMYPYLLEGGAAMTLHDRTLYDMAMKYWEHKSRPRFWLDFIASEGAGGLRKALAPIPGKGGTISQRIMQNLYADEENKRVKFTFMRRVVSRARGIAAHSKTVLDHARRFGASCPTLLTPLAVEKAPPPPGKPEARVSLGLGSEGVSSGAFVVLAYGFIQRHKRMEALIDSWQQYIKTNKNAKLILLGRKSPDYGIDEAISKRNLDDYVLIDDSYPPMEKVYRYLYAADLCVNLRYPVYGSSSYSLMQILSAGRPCAVTNLETFAEFPDEVVIKVPYGAGEVEELVKIFTRSSESPGEFEKVGQRAREYVESNCLWEHAGPRYMKFLDEIYMSL